MEFIQSILAHDVAFASPTVYNVDLPVNPLSHILITLKMAALAPVVTESPAFSSIMAMMERIEVLYKGSAVYSLNGIDCMASGVLVNNFQSWGVNAVDVDNAEWAVTFLVPMTRTLYSPTECFPRTTRGELILQITPQTTFLHFDDVRLQIETVELPDASPAQFIKQTTKTATVMATGQYDIELPIGNDISELVLYGATIPKDDADLPNFNLMEILVDNVNHFYPESHYDTIQNMAGRMHAAPGYWGYHMQETPVTPAVAGGPVTAVIPANHILSNHLHLPFDIFKNGDYALHTAGASDVCLRIDAQTAGVDVGNIRCIPVEVVTSAGAV